MKKLIILFCLLILLSGCGEIQITSQSVAGICGDNVCTVDENCNCQDCKNELECTPLKEEKIVSCDDKDPCTKDTYIKEIDQCTHELLTDCCGNNICEIGERCNEKIHQTNCIEDCNLNCPAVVVLHKNINTKGDQEKSFGCASESCIDMNNNNFIFKGSGSIMTIIENIGEFSTKPITSSFNCRTELGTLIASRDNQEEEGIIFNDFFNNNQESLYFIDGNIKPTNYATYQLNFTIKELKQKPLKINCGINLNSVTFISNQRVFITFN